WQHPDGGARADVARTAPPQHAMNTPARLPDHRSISVRPDHKAPARKRGGAERVRVGAARLHQRPVPVAPVSKMQHQRPHTRSQRTAAKAQWNVGWVGFFTRPNAPVPKCWVSQALDPTYRFLVCAHPIWQHAFLIARGHAMPLAIKQIIDISLELDDSKFKMRTPAGFKK